MLATRDTIIQFIPQRMPMVMIHELVEASNTHTITRLTVETANIFVSKGFLTEPGLVENIAQTAAAHVGYLCAVKKNPVPIGYIAAVKDLKILQLPAQNTVITTTVKITNQILDVTIAEGKIELDGQLCCSCEIRIFVKNGV